jgi:hypothetical protein
MRTGEELEAVLDDPVVCAALRQTWADSQPGLSGGHEEGGFILRDPAGVLAVMRWPKGRQDVIFVPAHMNCQVGGSDIVASFHTHPNTGPDYLQEPSETDIRAVRDDPNLKGRLYLGELVLSQKAIYRISPNGLVSEAGLLSRLLGDA